MLRLSITESGGAWAVHDDALGELIRLGSEASAMNAAAGYAQASPAERKVLVLYDDGDWREVALGSPRHQRH
jgi:hypothetical protein